ncbi:hypothetical protein COCSADRAFT_252588 [Bipolaris sorokiniana ND90Pr]|uniref:Uncharacterized protein n=1 Tax=Cochliobolus sativus (strain ND90Pr / ATCC 201652) TaxID=665912 RepID=M2RXA2_COCSN|nr:uncharacterized protein COCSADRAFT_252588 [Bipolaris sorokiniana ND90Pr]EMD59678.1 hypothetical protein COCSADRAFT_252588 [Bipolaris sorokiniana ND90Pr]
MLQQRLCLLPSPVLPALAQERDKPRPQSLLLMPPDKFSAPRKPKKNEEEEQEQEQESNCIAKLPSRPQVSNFFCSQKKPTRPPSFFNKTALHETSVANPIQTHATNALFPLLLKKPK